MMSATIRTIRPRTPSAAEECVLTPTDKHHSRYQVQDSLAGWTKP